MQRRRLMWLALVWPLTVTAAADRVKDVQVGDLDGRVIRPFATGAAASVVFFVATDCPVSNAYAPEIERVCREFAPRGVGCSLMYEDVDTAASPATLDRQVRTHLDEYKHRGLPAAIDRSRAVATAVRATITPTAVVVDRQGAVRYRGRVDNLYAALGKTRQQITSRDLRDALDAVLAGRPVAHPETEAIGCFITDPALLRTHEHE
jgi:thiol-disulfide isomerase/thioredoxin